MPNLLNRAAFAAVAFSAVVAHAAAPAMTAETAKRPALVDIESMSLYTFAKDTKPGDITGDGLLNGAWHIAKP